MQFACLSIDFDHIKFQPRSVSHSGKTSTPVGDQERSVGVIFLKLCEAYEAKTAPASSPAISTESVAWISPSNGSYAILQRYAARQHTAVISRTSIARRNPCNGFCTDGRRACWSSFSFVSFSQLEKNLPNRSFLVATGRVRLSAMANATRLKLDMVEVYR